MAAAAHRLDPSPTEDAAAGFDVHRRALRRHCSRMLGPADADDAVQETLLRAWRASARFEQRCSTGTWLHRIATNVCLDMLRARRLRPVLVADVEADEVPGTTRGADVVDTVVQRAEAAGVVTHLAGLPVRQRTAFVLREVFGWPAVDVAEVLGSSVAAANSALQRARAEVRMAVTADGATRAPVAVAADEPPGHR